MRSVIFRTTQLPIVGFIAAIAAISMSRPIHAETDQDGWRVGLIKGLSHGCDEMAKSMEEAGGRKILVKIAGFMFSATCNLGMDDWAKTSANAATSVQIDPEALAEAVNRLRQMPAQSASVEMTAPSQIGDEPPGSDRSALAISKLVIHLGPAK